MPINFFDNGCQEDARTDALFGIMDNAKRAYATLKNEEDWNATVVNTKELPVVFTAIDNCVIKHHEEPGVGRCDGMLTFNNSLYLIELKNQQARTWFSGAKNQLIDSINLLKENHLIDSFTDRKAYACNIGKPYFPDGNNSTQKKFKNETGFVLIVETTIIVE